MFEQREERQGEERASFCVVLAFFYLTRALCLRILLTHPVSGRDVLRRCPRRLGVRHAVDRARFVQEGGDAERRNISVARIDLRRPDRRDGVDREALRGGEKRVGCAVVGRVEGEIGRHGVGLVPVPDVDARRGSVRGVGESPNHLSYLHAESGRV